MGFIKKPKSQVAATPAEAPKKGGDGVYSFAVYAKSKDDEKADKVSGLWAHEGKNGAYYKGTNKTLGVQLFAFPRMDKKTKQLEGYKLQRRDLEDEGFNPVECGLLVAKKKKNGEEFFACTDEDGTDWIMFTAKKED